MLNLNISRIELSQMMPKSDLVASIAEGALLVGVMEGGRLVAKPSTGSGTERPLGFGRSQFMNPVSAPKVETTVVPASPYKITLQKTPNHAAVGDIGVFINGVAATVAATSPGGTGEAQWVVGSKDIIFHSTDATKDIKVVYSYDLTLIEAQMLYGQGIGDAGQSVVNGLDVITKAQVLFTDFYDASDNWATTSGPIKCGPGGKMTLAGSGTPLDKCYVIQAPTANNPFLGVYVSF